MIDTPHIVQTEVQTTAIVPVTATWENISEVMDEGVNELLTVLSAQGITPTGPLFTHHLRRPTETFEFEISFPVGATVAATGRVHASQLPATTVVRTVYHGPYEGLGDAWGELMAWIDAQGLKPAEDLWEVYLVGPESEENPAKWTTILNRPLLP